MMYNEKFVAAIKVDGKVLREQENLVTLPFGSEYSLLLKNLEGRRAQVRVSIDGQDATNGSLIIGSNESVELERFIKSLDKGNRFKFIERTEDIENHRGIKAEDGLIRVEYQFEVKPVEITRTKVIQEYEYVPSYRKSWYPWYSPDRPPYYGTWCGGGPNQAQGYAMNCAGYPQEAMKSLRGNHFSGERRLSGSAGITVAGSESNQKFQNVSGFQLDPQKHVIVLQLRGEVGGKKISSPVTVERKLSCDTCGKSNKPENKFCTNCGTSLNIF